ncbi:MAG: ABC transporter ATP-binding protein/permease [Thermoanaerobaculia bacterium]|nr:ABC transporter ATP-binding protein/permease [Thermoanaerobaculia bacterium]
MTATETDEPTSQISESPDTDPEDSADTGKKTRRAKLTSVWAEARHLIWQRRKRLALGLVLIVVGRLAGLVMPASSKYLVDEVLVGGRVELLRPLALAVLAATTLQALSSFTLAQLLSIAAQRAITEMRKDVQQHVIRLPVSYFDSTKAGVLVSRIMTDAEGIRNLVGTGLVQMIGGMMTATLSLVVLFYLNWKMTLVTLSLVLVFGGGMAAAFRRLRPLFRLRSELYARVTGRLTETLGGARIVKAYSAERREDLVFAKGAHELFRNVARTITTTSSVTAGTTFLFGLVGVVMMLMGGNAILSDTMTLGDFVSYVFFTGTLAAPMVQISNIGTQITEAFAGLDRIHELRQVATEDEEDAVRAPLQQIRGDITFEDVHFEYEEDQPVLRGVSFDAPAGTTTALVGSSGSGKSTTIGLVTAFQRPKSGRILVDGKDLEDLRLHDYRKNLGIVLQDNFLFDGTVAENIAFARPHASREEILEAGRIAHCHDFVEGFPDGWDTIVGERGVKVSGGQRQRIAIARAILADPSILILDEATSSLDSESEAKIRDGLESLRQGRTTFVIAHRLSTIRSADQILVLEDGEIVERGSHDELIARAGRYKELHDKQHAWEANRFVNPGEELPTTGSQ